MRFRSLLAAVVLLLTTAALSHAQVSTDSDFITHMYGLTSTNTQRPTNPTVGTTATRLFANAPARFSLLCCNLSTNLCYANTVATVSATNGFLLSTGGGCFQTDAKDDLLLPTNEWWFVCAGASSQLYCLESLLQ